MATAAKSFIAVTVTLTASAAILAIVAISAGFVGKPIRYEIAEPFQGWVTVIYENTSCQALKKDGLFLVIHVNESGKGCSSSPIPLGWRYTKFVHVAKDGTQTTLVHSSWASEQSRMIWAGAVMTPQGGYSHVGEIFYVGTADQLKEAWSHQPIPK